MTQFFRSGAILPRRNNAYSFDANDFGSTWSIAVEIINEGIRNMKK